LDKYQRLSYKSLHQQLLKNVDSDLEAALISVQDGSGKVRMLEPESAAEAFPSEISMKVVADPGFEAGEAMDVQESIPKVSPTTLPSDSVSVSPISDSPAPKVDKPPKKSRQPVIGPALKRLGNAGRGSLRDLSRGTSDFLKRMLPDESILTIPSSVMAFIAVAVPIVIVAVASVVYFREGRARMYSEAMLQAQTAAQIASQTENVDEVRDGWNEVLDHVNQAETYQVTDDSQALRSYAMSIIDELEMIERLDFQPAFAEQLPYNLEIEKIVSNLDNDLYMLNGIDGNVLRATFSANGFVLDSEFVCGPVPQPLIVGPLIDIVALLPGDPDGATVMGMDSDGNLLKCIPGGKSPLAFQMGYPDTNWGSPLAFAMDSGDLYVLDPQTNAVWIFWERDDYRDSPRLFFGQQIPPMQDVIDLTISGEDLYLLHADSHITTCVFSLLRESPTRCTEPAIFSDPREGREDGAYVQGAVFSEIQYAPPPDPSIYLLDPEERSIYHFSKLLVYQRQYRSQNTLPVGLASAFTISQNQIAFMAIENQVFFSRLP
jgi:hypothetical protein